MRRFLADATAAIALTGFLGLALTWGAAFAG